MCTFNFLPQASSVEKLLKACIAAMIHVPSPEKEVLIEAMREFENFGSPSLWSPSDVDSDDEMGLTKGEKRDVRDVVFPLQTLYALWDKLGNMPTTENAGSEQVLETRFLHFQALTPCETVWRWFESQDPRFIVGDVMAGKRHPT